MINKKKLDELRSYIEELKTIEVLEDRNLILKENKLEKSFLEVKKRTCLLKNGKIIEREQILKNGSHGSAAIVLPVTKEGNTILVVQPRVLTESTVGVEFPAGYIEDNEEPINAARRELVEETGYVPKDIMFLAKYYQDQGCSSAFNYSYLATDCVKKMKQHLDESEYIRYFECTYQEMLELADEGYINDANSLIALEKSKKLIKDNRRNISLY